jgi:hypothetical protein
MGKPIKPDYECEDCGATTSTPVSECCDWCLLTLFSGEHSPMLDLALHRYKSVADWVKDETDYSPDEETEDN